METAGEPQSRKIVQIHIDSTFNVGVRETEIIMCPHSTAVFGYIALLPSSIPGNYSFSSQNGAELLASTLVKDVSALLGTSSRPPLDPSFILIVKLLFWVWLFALFKYVKWCEGR